MNHCECKSEIMTDVSFISAENLFDSWPTGLDGSLYIIAYAAYALNNLHSTES